MSLIVSRELSDKLQLTTNRHREIIVDKSNDLFEILLSFIS